MFTRQEILDRLHNQLLVNGHIISVSAGSGMTAKYAARGGADLILALNSGRFRQMGIGSLAGLMPFQNSNQMVMEFGTKELLPAVRDTPVLFGLCATDPTIYIEKYLEQIKNCGFSGINNFPTVGMIGGKFREALEEAGLCYQNEVDAIHLAHNMGMFTMAFVFDTTQALQMIDVGADVICVHLGLTTGGLLGAKKTLSLKAAAEIAKEIFEACDQVSPNVLKMVYGGPIATPHDMQFIYRNTEAHGYVGGSTFERTPTEQAITNITRDFKFAGWSEYELALHKMLDGSKKHYDYIGFVKEYVAQNYQEHISFHDLAVAAHVSRSHLSALFRKEVGCTFPSYLTNFRIKKACELMKVTHIPLQQIAEMVGYPDYAHFSKMFKKEMGTSPAKYYEEERKKHKNDV